MKKLAILFLIFMALPTLVLAGESVDVDIQDVLTQAVYLYEGDEVRFDVLGGTHSLIIEEVSVQSAAVTLDVVPFLNEGSPDVGYGFVTLDTVNRLDLDRDGYTDVNVALYGVSEDGEVHLVIQNVGDVDRAPNQEPGLVVNGEDTKDNKNTLLVIIAVLIGIVVFFYFFKGKIFTEEKKEKDTPKEHHFKPKEEEPKEESEEKTEEEPEEEPKEESKEEPKEESKEEPKEESKEEPIEESEEKKEESS
jgi:hypothetical protein